MVTSVGSRRKIARNLARGAGALLGLATLTGCSADKVLDAVNPVTWYRDVTGASKTDPNADTANAANLEAGSQEPTPNLSEVPNPPTRGLTEEQQLALATGLVADRDHAHYTDEQIRAGNAGAVMPAQVKVPEEQLPPGPKAPPPAPDSAGAPKSGSPALGNKPAAPPPAATPVAASQDTPIGTPVARAAPEPETPQTPPGPPEMKPLPPPEPDQPFPNVPKTPPLPGAGPDQVAGVPVPPPPPVRAEATPPVPGAIPATPAAPPGVVPGKRSKSSEVAQVVFTAGAATLPADAGASIATVPALHQKYGGVVRVVGYAAATNASGDQSAQQLAAYQAALARAAAVKQALVAAGVPAAEIVTEASPVRGAGNAPERADIYIEY